LETSRLLLAILLSLGLVFVYQEFVLKRMLPPPPPQKTNEQMPNATASGEMAAAAAAPLPVPMAPITAALAGSSNAPEKTIEIDTELYRAVFTTRGARLKSYQLKQYRTAAASNSPPYEMVRATGADELPLGVTLDEDGKVADDRELDYASDQPNQVELRDGSGPISVSVPRRPTAPPSRRPSRSWATSTSSI